MFRAKNYERRIIFARVTAKNIGDHFLRHSVVMYTHTFTFASHQNAHGRRTKIEIELKPTLLCSLLATCTSYSKHVFSHTAEELLASVCDNGDDDDDV